MKGHQLDAILATVCLVIGFATTHATVDALARESLLALPIALGALMAFVISMLLYAAAVTRYRWERGDRE